jgi:hypothetical protein
MPAGRRSGAAVKKVKAAQARRVSGASRCTREDFLVREIAETERDVEGARGLQSYTALVQLRKHLAQLHAELVALRLSAAAQRAEHVSPEQAMAELRQVVADLPMDALIEIEQAIRRRRVRVA